MDHCSWIHFSPKIPSSKSHVSFREAIYLQFRHDFMKHTIGWACPSFTVSNNKLFQQFLIPVHLLSRWLFWHMSKPYMACLWDKCPSFLQVESWSSAQMLGIDVVVEAGGKLGFQVWDEGPVNPGEIWVFPKIMGKPPNHPFVHRVFHEIFTIHFGVFPTYFGSTPICRSKFPPSFKTSEFGAIKFMELLEGAPNCWWLKSQTTTWDGAETLSIMGKRTYLNWLAGFQPSTVLPSNLGIMIGNYNYKGPFEPISFLGISVPRFVLVSVNWGKIQISKILEVGDGRKIAQKRGRKLKKRGESFLRLRNWGGLCGPCWLDGGLPKTLGIQ